MTFPYSFNIGPVPFNPLSPERTSVNSQGRESLGSDHTIPLKPQGGGSYRPDGAPQ